MQCIIAPLWCETFSCWLPVKKSVKIEGLQLLNFKTMSSSVA